MGIALGNIIAAIMMAHAATNATPAPSVGVIAISMPAMSSPAIGDQNIASQAAAVTTRSAAYVMTVARSAVAGTQSPITMPPSTLMAWPVM